MKYNTKYILAIIEFDYDTKESRFVPNSIRQSFLGLERANPNIPKKLIELNCIQKDIIKPIYFSLIKKPIKIELPDKKGYKIKNPATGAMILYEFLGNSEDLKRCINILDKYLRDLKEKGKPKYFSFISNFDFIIGKVWDDQPEKI